MARFAFIFLALLSGAAALSHELLWTRRLIDLLGATEWVTGRVLGLFFLGLSLGGWLATRLADRGNPAVRFAIAELAIAILSVPAMLLPWWADGIIAGMGTEQLLSWQGSAIKLLLSVAVVLPPAIAMGVTMPLLIRVSTYLGGTVKGTGLVIYSINMLGGVFGLWVSSVYLLDWFGVQGTMMWVACLNAAIAIVAIAMARITQTQDDQIRGTNTTHPLGGADDAGEGNRSYACQPNVLLLAFLSGAFVLALEILLLRLMALVAPSSFFTTSALLANVILFLSIGALLVGLLNRFGMSNQLQLVIGFTGAAICCLLCPVILYHHTDKLISLRYLVGLNGGTMDSLGEYWWLVCGTIAVAAGAGLVFSGFVFPAILSLNSKRDPEGKSVGKLLAINGLGGLLGCEIANGWLMETFGIYGGFVVLAATMGVFVVVYGFCLGKGLWSLGILTLALGISLPLFVAYGDLTYISPKTKIKYAIEEIDFSREGVLMVVNTPSPQGQSKSILMNNQYILGSTGQADAERRQLLLPWLLHPEANQVCCLGLATGISASGLEQLQDPPAVTSVELSATVAEVAKEFFQTENGDFFARDDNRVAVEDARTFIAASHEDYDLIVADLFRPFGLGESRLFSVEHFGNAKRALKAEGMFCQWLPAHQLTQEQFRIIAATFLRVFPETMVINGGFSAQTPSIGLCGWKSDRPWETAELKRKIESFRTQKGIKDVVALNPQLLIAGRLDPESYSNEPINTLDNALMELKAGKFWILKDLRPKRTPDDLSNGFLSGDNFKAFMKTLYEESEAILDPVHRTQFLRGLQ